MSAFIRKISTIGIIFTLMMFCVGMASAATYDQYGRDIEKQTGYITIDEILDNPDRYYLFNEVDETNTYIDMYSFKKVREDSKYYGLNCKIFFVNYDLGAITLINATFKYDKVDVGTIYIKYNHSISYDLEGQYLDSDKPYKAETIKLPYYGAYNALANIAYFKYTGTEYDANWFKELRERFKNAKFE